MRIICEYMLTRIVRQIDIETCLNAHTQTRARAHTHTHKHTHTHTYTHTHTHTHAHIHTHTHTTTLYMNASQATCKEYLRHRPEILKRVKIFDATLK